MKPAAPPPSPARHSSAWLRWLPASGSSLVAAQSLPAMVPPTGACLSVGAGVLRAICMPVGSRFSSSSRSLRALRFLLGSAVAAQPSQLATDDRLSRRRDAGSDLLNAFASGERSALLFFLSSFDTRERNVLFFGLFFWLL